MFSIRYWKEQPKQTLYLCFTLSLSGENKSSHNSPPQIKTDAVEEKWKKEGAEERKEREAGSSSIEEEGLTAANDSLCSDNLPCVDEKGIEWHVTTTAVTELKPYCCNLIRAKSNICIMPHIWFLKLANNNTVEIYTNLIPMLVLQETAHRLQQSTLWSLMSPWLRMR